MAKRPRCDHSPAFKAKVALAAVKSDKTLVESSEHFDIHANQITQWKTQLLERACLETVPLNLRYSDLFGYTRGA